ncbi:MAG: HD domain-containing protein [Candidatus Bathyarchaeia archaeon]
MVEEIDDLIELISDERLRTIVRLLLQEPRIEFEGKRLSLGEAPAGSRVHHSYSGGLLEHTIAVVKLAKTLSDIVEQVYDCRVNRDLVLAGALIHDTMKRYVYVPDEKGGFSPSPLGERIDHLTLLIAEMYRLGCPLDLIHVVASHHGDASPISPRTIEALIVSIADYADSEMNRKVQRAAEYILENAGESLKPRSSKEAFRILKTKAEEGIEGVRRLLHGEA